MAIRVNKKNQIYQHIPQFEIIDHQLTFVLKNQTYQHIP